MKQRAISSGALLLASISAILGSGWLFAAYYTSTLAGPGAILSWITGGAIVILISFTFAELSAMLPITGSSTRIPQYTHGTIVSFVFSWMIWLSYAALTPTEVQSVLQYFAYFFPQLIHPGGGLTRSGYAGATVLMLAISIFNTMSLRWLMRCNNILTVLKIAIPLIISVVILVLYFSPQQIIHPAHSEFLPLGVHGVFAAIATGGIVFAFNGFKQACELAGEAKNPHWSLPFAIIGSVGACLIIYLLLQLAFIAALSPANLALGWSQLQLSGADSPLAAILAEKQLNHWLPLLYLGAIIGPLAAALMYMSSSSRSLYGQSKNDYLPLFLQKLNTHGHPIYAIIVNFIVGMCLFAPLPGWNKMISFLTSLMAITYAIAPISLLALRKQIPEQPRPFKLPCVKLFGFSAFYLCTLMSYWSGWDIISKLGISFAAGMIVLLAYHFGTARGRMLQFHWRESVWIWPYFIGLSLISYLGSFGNGLNLLPFGWDFVVIAAFCAIIIGLAQHFILPASTTRQYIDRLTLH